MRSVVVYNADVVCVGLHGAKPRTRKKPIARPIKSQIEYNLHKYVTDEKVKIQFSREIINTNMKITVDKRLFVKVNRNAMIQTMQNYESHDSDDEDTVVRCEPDFMREMRGNSFENRQYREIHNLDAHEKLNI